MGVCVRLYGCTVAVCVCAFMCLYVIKFYLTGNIMFQKFKYFWVSEQKATSDVLILKGTICKMSPHKHHG